MERELLPRNVVPTHYDLTLEPELERHTFKGSVTIDLEVTQASNSITLHTLDLEIQSSRASIDGEYTSSPLRVSHDKTAQTSTFELDRCAEQGSKVLLEITFTGELNNIMAGFSRSFFNRADGSESMIASTQMEATDCRRVLPCFDEPALKAQFTVKLIVDEHLTALSNMDIAREDRSGTKKLVSFNKTPKMSTYLLAIVIGELEYVESLDFCVPLRVYMPKGYDIAQGSFALKLAVKALPFYENIFGLDFPLPKLDQVAIPEFAAGAMENWGLITYSVTDLLLEEITASASQKLNVAEVVLHELAHQWFGNLVTMDWWEGLWLNEGFATWASWYSCNHFFPEWRVWEGYVTGTLESALKLDSLRSSHPVEVRINNADEVNEIFDDISYAKGSCVLRMLSIHIGEDKFLEGIRIYLRKHAYGNTNTTDLWDCMSEATGRPIGSIMDTWTKKIGYPVVTVEEKGGDMILTQNRFLRSGDLKADDDTILYNVFLNVRSDAGIDLETTLQTKKRTIRIPDSDFFKLNANQTGLYRTCYQSDRLEKLGIAAKRGLLSVEDRAGLVSDSFALSISGHQKTSGFLELLKNFDDETEHTVWQSVISDLSELRATWMSESSAVSEALDSFQRQLVGPYANLLGWDITSDDTQSVQHCKSLLFAAAGAVGDEKVVAAAKKMFAQYMSNEAPLQTNLRPAVFALGIKYGGEKEFDQMMTLYSKTKSKDEALDCLEALGRNDNPVLVQRCMDLILTKDLGNQDSYKLFNGLNAHMKGIDSLLSYLTENWERMIEEMPPTLPVLTRNLTHMTMAINSQERLDTLVGFFENRDTTGFENTLKQTVESIRSRIFWTERDREDVTAWLKDNGYLT